MQKLNKIVIVEAGDHFSSFRTGLRTFIDGFIKYAPEDFKIEVVGISTNLKERPLGKRVLSRIGNKQFSFLPVYFKKDERIHSLIDLLKFSLCLRGLDLNGKVVIFNQLGPAVLFGNSRNSKVLIIHSDVQRMVCKGGNMFRLAGFFPWLYFNAEKYVYRRIDYVGSMSRKTVDFYLSYYAKQKEKFFCISHSIDPQIFFPFSGEKVDLRETLSWDISGIGKDAKWILFVGRLAAEKAPRRLIDSFALYNNLNRNSHLLIIGGESRGRPEAYLKKYIEEKRLKNNVSLLGMMSREKVAQFYRASDVFLLTSDFEGGPFVVLEALACGLPVVTTDVGQVREFVKPGFSGEIAFGFEAQNISRCLKKVVDNPQIYTRENCVNCAKGYSAEEVYREVYNLCRKLMHLENRLIGKTA